jgi:hypothetical protein
MRKQKLRKDLPKSTQPVRGEVIRDRFISKDKENAALQKFAIKEI